MFPSYCESKKNALFKSTSSALLVLGGAATFAIGAAAPAAAITISGTNTTDGFSDGDFFDVQTRDITFTADDFTSAGATGIIEDVNLDVFFAKSSDDSFVPETSSITPGFPFFNEIFFSITSPSGTSVTLIRNFLNPTLFGSPSFGFGENGFQGIVTFDQDAADPVNVDPNNITAGTFQPATNGGNLDAFNGESAIGTWVFAFSDALPLDGLSFYETTLIVETQPIPFELETGASLVALAGLFGLRKLCQRRVKA